ncbi:hypothetical protein AQ611_00990 [Burkholderia singularis]|nr:hypothetical protein AQ611_00990 [Burkholderia sp. Bp7605]
MHARHAFVIRQIRSRGAEARNRAGGGTHARRSAEHCRRLFPLYLRDLSSPRFLQRRPESAPIC